jgi:hypothetical protein
MMKAKVSHNLISFVTVRRGNWIMKISIFKNRYVLLVAQNYFNAGKFFVKQFTDHNAAADFIETIAKEDIEDEY